MSFGEIKKGIFLKARFVESPNFDDRPKGSRIEALIIHSISLPPGEYQSDYVEQFFCNQLNPNKHPYFEEICHLTVSSHFYIKRDGEVVQFVNTEQRAWHAGKSFCLGRENVNDFSVGIELEGWDEGTDGYTDAQYAELLALSQSLMATYDIDVNAIFGHSDIAPGRKNDPGPQFDWHRYKSALS